ncbi:MAG: cupredoxin domain-containing protein [Candidatus Roizmanbacteria bacterium]|nr:cupredoxin domain-containing protein [Candidatus Roizmanbacteria bacterium]
MEENTAQKGNMTPLIIGIGVLVVLAGGFFLFKSNSSSNQMKALPTQTMREDTTTEDAVMEENTESSEESMMEANTTGGMSDEADMTSEGDVAMLDVEGGSFYFKPNVIRMKKGQTVKVTFHAADAMHDFDIDELNLDSKVIKSGETSTFEITPDETGEFEFYCSVGQHRANGMVGTLVVEE